MNIRTLAKDLNLSTSTISICLSGKPEEYKITPETVKRVRDYADKVGYVPNHWARKIFKDDSETIGLMVINDLGLDKNNRALHWITEALSRNNMDFIMLVAWPGHWREALNQFKGMKIKKIVCIGIFFDYSNEEMNIHNRNRMIDSEVFREFTADESIKFYAIDYNFPGNEYYEHNNFFRIGSNRQETYLQLCHMLMKAGKGPIICDKGCFPEYLKEHGVIAPDMEALPAGEDSFEAGYRLKDAVIQRWKSGMAKIVLIHNDRRAIGLIRGLNECGIRVPEDIEVVGFGNLDFGAEAPVPITSIHLPIMENAQLLADALINNKELQTRIEQPVEIIWRKSAKQPISNFNPN